MLSLRQHAWVVAQMTEPTERQTIILETIEELAEDLAGLSAAHEAKDLDGDSIYLGHHLWNLPPGLLPIIEDWLHVEIDDRRKQWGLEDPERLGRETE